MESGTHFLEKDIEKNYRGHYLRVQTNIPLDKSKTEMDCLEPNIINIYKESARE